jgi:hypothetical protein
MGFGFLWQLSSEEPFVHDWRELRRDGIDDMGARESEKRLATRWPWGGERFVEKLEQRLGRTLRKARSGPIRRKPRRRNREGI